jgi:hypothetical protein
MPSGHEVERDEGVADATVAAIKAKLRGVGVKRRRSVAGRRGRRGGKAL